MLELQVKVARLARDLKPELKYCFNNNNAGITVANTVSLQNGGVATDGHYVSQYPICAVAEGDDATNRTGRKIKLKSVRFEYLFRQQTNTHQAVKVNVMLVQKLQYSPNSWGTTPTDMQYLLDLNCAGCYSANSARSLEYKKNFRVLGTHVLTVPADNYTTQLRIKSGVHIFKMPHGGVEMQYNSTNAQALQSPGIFVVMFADYGDIATNALTGVQFNYACKSFFTDV